MPFWIYFGNVSRPLEWRGSMQLLSIWNVQHRSSCFFAGFIQPNTIVHWLPRWRGLFARRFDCAISSWKMGHSEWNIHTSKLPCWLPTDQFIQWRLSRFIFKRTSAVPKVPNGQVHNKLQYRRMSELSCR